jgi:hypothetical protein
LASLDSNLKATELTGEVDEEESPGAYMFTEVEFLGFGSTAETIVKTG